ncbi:hypothetical protein IKG54_01215 [Candidatus Saccharibacteria bacterium]|nr:hypothetical protein [Candidatus Saccharibacteria bacterium]
MKEKIRTFLKEFFREGGFAFTVAGLCYLFLAIMGIMVLLSGCGQVETAEDSTEIHQRKLASKDSLSVTIRPGEMDTEKGFYAAEDLGSHVMYITHPKVDAELQQQMGTYHMDVVEVYFAKDEGDDKPAFEAEPEASAVYYFFQDSAKEITISWQDPEGAGTLVTGAHLDDPSYVMKYLVTGRKGEPEAIDCLSVSDFTGGEVYFSNVKNSRFTVDSLTIDSETLRDSALAGEL